MQECSDGQSFFFIIASPDPAPAIIGSAMLNRHRTIIEGDSVQQIHKRKFPLVYVSFILIKIAPGHTPRRA